MNLLHDLWRSHEFKLLQSGRTLSLDWMQILTLLYDVTLIDFDRVEADGGTWWSGRFYGSLKNQHRPFVSEYL